MTADENALIGRAVVEAYQLGNLIRLVSAGAGESIEENVLHDALALCATVASRIAADLDRVRYPNG